MEEDEYVCAEITNDGLVVCPSCEEEFDYGKPPDVTTCPYCGAHLDLRTPLFDEWSFPTRFFY